MDVSFEDLFRAGAYPAMSHPSADPLANSAVARKAGISTTDTAGARILEIGCGTGHHIISLANRWPGAQCTGIDLSGQMIARARSRAKRAGVKNVGFCEVSLLEFEPEGAYDYIIAHGFFSWVPDEVKVGLMQFIGRRLASDGIAVVSFNVAAGWKSRMPVVAKVRAIQMAGGVDEMTALTVFREASGNAEEVAIIDDMLAKGAAVLAFDDFAPVMDAWSLGAFEKLASESGLFCMGDSVSGEKGSDAGDDETKRTFRSEIVCRKDAVLSGIQLDVPFVPERDASVPAFPKLDEWRRLCAREGLPVVDADLKPCVFPVSQLPLLAAMDGMVAHVGIAAMARQQCPDLAVVPWLRHLAERGLFV